jgi:predicted kinase
VTGPPRVVILVAGLPATGKTTTAHRLHARLGGALIRSCDVYAARGISLPDWIRRTEGLTRDVAAYDTLREAAYAEMSRRLVVRLESGSSPVIVDAVHGERARRRALRELCRGYGTVPAVVWCRCDDMHEIERRFAAREGRESIPEHEASDLAVFRYIARRWEDPTGDRPALPMVVFDTLHGSLSRPEGAPPESIRLIESALMPYAREACPHLT